MQKLEIPWSKLPWGGVDLLRQEASDALERFRAAAREHMFGVFNLKVRRMELWTDIIGEEAQGHLVVTTMDSFIKYRSGELAGYANEVLKRLEVKLFCMEEYESVSYTHLTLPTIYSV